MVQKQNTHNIYHKRVKDGVNGVNSKIAMGINITLKSHPLSYLVENLLALSLRYMGLNHSKRE